MRISLRPFPHPLFCSAVTIPSRYSCSFLDSRANATSDAEPCRMSLLTGAADFLSCFNLWLVCRLPQFYGLCQGREDKEMGLLAWLVVGLIAGWLAGLVMKGGGYGVLVDILLGILGGFLGGWIFGKLGIWSGGGSDRSQMHSSAPAWSERTASPQAGGRMRIR